MVEDGAISFDRASHYYDSTRALTAQTMAKAMAQVVPELTGTDCLEIGVGTGRFALPLHKAGVSMYGLDISSSMLAKLVDKADGLPFPLATADATALPFRDAVFQSALAVHVLHLIPNWTGALDELRRVVAPGGRLVVDPGGWGRGSWKLLQEIFCDAAGIARRHPGANDPHEVDEAMVERGTRVRLLEAIVERRKLAYRAIVKLLEDGVFSFTWRTDQAGRTRGADAIREYLRSRGQTLDDIMVFELPIVWRVYEL